MNDDAMQKINKYILPLLLIALFFAIPIEHKYDKLFRYYSWTLVPANLSFPDDFNPKIFFYASDIITFIFFIWALIKLRLRIFEKGFTFLALFFGLTILSIFFSGQPQYPIPYIRLIQLLTPISLFLFLANAPFSSDRLFKFTSWSLFSSGLIQALIGVLQYFSQGNLNLRFFGEQQLNAKIFVPHGHRWLPDAWMNRSFETPDLYRAMGTLPHPNVLGGLLMVSLLITSYLFLKHQAFRKWLSLAYFLQMFALFITFSRSALFATIIASVIWLFIMRCYQKISIRSTTLLILSSLAISSFLLFEQIIERGGVINYASLARASDHVRFFYQDIALRMIFEHPLLGVGFQQFSAAAPSFLPLGSELMPASKSVVHNIYLSIGAESGLIALIAFFSWIIFLIRTAWRSKQIKSETGLFFAIFIGFLFIGCCDFYPIFFQQGKLLFFGCAGLLAHFGLTISKDDAVAA